ncbi:MAG TPA: DUF1963 domain-containing protein [Kofleriaceae bacterium]
MGKRVGAKTALAKAAAKVLKSHPIGGAKISPGTPVTRDWLAYCFHLFITIEEKEIPSKAADAPGSRLLGRPLLPAGVKWPQGYYFYAQLEMRELTAHDLLGVLPDSGTLYLFYNPMAKDFLPASKTAAKAVFVAGETAPRTLHAVPPKSKLPEGGKHYYKDFVGKSYRLTFEPVFAFDNVHTLPAGLVEAMTKALGIRCVPAPEFGAATTMFGKPVSWEGEGEEGLFAPDEWDWEDGLPPSDPDRVLLLQRDFVDSHLHFWGNRKGDATGRLLAARGHGVRRLITVG